MQLRGKFNVYKIAVLGLFAGLALALAFIESLFPTLPFLPPGVKPGFANIVIMYLLLDPFGNCAVQGRRPPLYEDTARDDNDAMCSFRRGLLFSGLKSAFIVGIIKSGFVFLIRGLTAFTLSISGSLLAILIMALILKFEKKKTSYVMISIAGAISHNIGQILVIYFIFNYSVVIFAYLPVLLIFGIIAGFLTATVLRVTTNR